MFLLNTDAQGDGKVKEKKSAKREALEWIIAFSLAILVAICLRMFVFEFVRVDGPSMQDTLFNDQYMFVTKIDYLFGDPHRGDVVVCHYPISDAEYVKRVIGLPGDRVLVKGGGVFINDTALEEPYISELMDSDMEEYTVPEGAYFVMGDNRNDSMDSRDLRIGALPRNMIIGHTQAVVWPLNAFKSIGQD